MTTTVLDTSAPNTQAAIERRQAGAHRPSTRPPGAAPRGNSGAATGAAARAPVDDPAVTYYASLLGVRIRALAEAQRADLECSEGARPALRQALVDVAADLEPVGSPAGR